MRFRALREDLPGPVWRSLFEQMWPSYRRWFLLEGERRRPTYLESRRQLTRHVPELVPLWHQLSDLAGGSDQVARFLSLYRPTPYLAGCSQVVWTGDEPALIRNYDYTPRLWEGVMLHTQWGDRPVIAMSDCLWGALDGINAAGLAVSLSFGGRQAVGDGFGSPLIVRYLLECCSTVSEARRVLERLPSHMAYNLTLVDASGDFATAYLSPDRAPIIRRWPIATNHQAAGEWSAYAKATGSHERESFLAQLYANPATTLYGLSASFLAPPLYMSNLERAQATLYTAIYYPRRGAVTLYWPDRYLTQSFSDFRELDITLSQPLRSTAAIHMSA